MEEKIEELLDGGGKQVDGVQVKYQKINIFRLPNQLKI